MKYIKTGMCLEVMTYPLAGEDRGGAGVCDSASRAGELVTVPAEEDALLLLNLLSSNNLDKESVRI